MKNYWLGILPWLRAAMVGGWLVSLCSCATEHPVGSNVWIETTFNTEAGLGKHLQVTMALEDGEKLLFAVDTGSPYTILDRSLQSKLGKSLGTKTIRYGWFGKKKVSIHHAPKLYMDHTRLMTADHVLLDDLAPVSSAPPVQGILGMDCLKHYCVQFDSENHKIRLFGLEKMKGQELGKPYPLHLLFGEVWVRGDFFGAGSSYFRLDSGWNSDGELKPAAFRKVLAGQKSVKPEEFKSPTGEKNYVACFDQLYFNGVKHSYLVLDSYPALGSNLIGLRYLVRNLVTIDFPDRVMYLQPRQEPSANNERRGSGQVETLVSRAIGGFGAIGEAPTARIISAWAGGPGIGPW